MDQQRRRDICYNAQLSRSASVPAPYRHPAPADHLMTDTTFRNLRRSPFGAAGDSCGREAASTIPTESLSVTHSTNTVRLHRVLRAPPERVYQRLPRPRRDGEVAAAARLHRQGPPDGRPRRRRLPDVVHQLRHRQEPFVRRHLHRAHAARADPLHRQVRRPQPARAKCRSPSRSPRSCAAPS